MNKFYLWMGLISVGILLGLWTTFKVYTVGFTVYAKTDVLVWTLPLSTYIFFSLTSAGLAFVSSFPVVFGIQRYEVIEKRTVYLEIAVLMGSFVCLLLHLGAPLSVVYILFSPNPASPLWWLAVLYIVYFILLISAFWRIHTGKISKTLGTLIFIIADLYIHDPWLAAGYDRCTAYLECLFLFVLFPINRACFWNGCVNLVHHGV